MKPFTIKATHTDGDRQEWRIVDLVTARGTEEAEAQLRRRMEAGRYPFVPSQASYKVEPMSRVEQSRLSHYARALSMPKRLPSTDTEVSEFIASRGVLVQSWCTACYINPALLEATETTSPEPEKLDETSGGGGEPERIQQDPSQDRGAEDALAALEKDMAEDAPSRGTDFDAFMS
ncbi:hypothetical protein SAMN04488047_1264 [Tranquillimonas alkanivorans]|uniref:Uncharacterized protein n=2 Tax=Tranquillimonas alkanivorans TaxID=441119 RepID=A0A1I5V0N7_9RHOB|nr:hypothetical protein SAMN04488047_1264 [Tranquillimonas alkanivorans]